MLFYAAALQTLNYDWDTLHPSEHPVFPGGAPGVKGAKRS